MSACMGLDMGTTHITAIVVDIAGGAVLARAAQPNSAEITPPARKKRGYCEWDATKMTHIALEVLRQATETAAGTAHIQALGVTGQMHGTVITDATLRPLTPFINWQDQRGLEARPGTGHSCVEHIAQHQPAQMNIATGYMATTLCWLQAQGFELAAARHACMIPDYVVARLSHSEPVTAPSNAASSGAFCPKAGQWAEPLIKALALPRHLFSPVRSAPALAGTLASEHAARTGLPAALPVAIAIGDNQASFIGSVADPGHQLGLTVGTGAQLSAFAPTWLEHPAIETRPFPGGGYLLVRASLAGGSAYAHLHRFFQEIGQTLLGGPAQDDLYDAMTALAASVPAGADGVRCEPTFQGSRHDPAAHASWSGLAPDTLTPGHLIRALLEGMARGFGQDYALLRQAGLPPRQRLIGSGNALRRNHVLGQAIVDALKMPLDLPAHQEEAAYGAALTAAVAAGLIPNLATASSRIRYTHGYQPG